MTRDHAPGRLMPFSLTVAILSLLAALCGAPAWAQEGEIPSSPEKVNGKNIFIGLAGSPGAGKTTQGARLSGRYSIPLISVANIMQLEIASRSELGNKAGTYAKRGDHVPSPLLTALVRERLSREDCRNGFILDGYPRRHDEFAAFQSILNDLKITNFRLLVLEVKPGDLVERLKNRRVCEKGHSYDLKLSPPKKEGTCDIDGLPLYQQDDDKPEGIQRNFEAYRKETTPVINYYTKKGACTIVDGSGSINTVFQRLIQIIEREKSKSN